jgi:hypothetical protein
MFSEDFRIIAEPPQLASAAGPKIPKIRPADDVCRKM